MWEKENRLKAEICEYVLPKSLEYIWLRWKQATGDSVLCRIQRKDDRIWGISLQAARAIAIAGIPFLSKVVLNKEEWRTVYDVEGSERDFNCFVDGVAGYCKTWGYDKEKKWLSCSVIATVKERKQGVSAEEKANALKELLLAQQGMQQGGSNQTLGLPKPSRFILSVSSASGGGTSRGRYGVSGFDQRSREASPTPSDGAECVDIGDDDKPMGSFEEQMLAPTPAAAVALRMGGRNDIRGVFSHPRGGASLIKETKEGVVALPPYVCPFSPPNRDQFRDMEDDDWEVFVGGRKKK
uniref:Uncharacterized protein n=1 Tax=Chromera velia CCMP2878 TaxID=1169474 RepID=A0A0G4HV11_9ALVE|eukprot:Cvel_8767.t1-p1 / transcript=Cvel_8767.t1 / gene=Cvel_8767 / organism=Chromera_velia_CCMP2878 / gene_product=hypothetical protein / transcript_product=hypothetical protein / location=Cvel_scaffold490:31838-33084(-) / protein_length=295 / sequence_SO=supercontig / SO=protein_coding / is_pseudo=false